jgi:ribosomal protein S15P/S13E
MNKNNKNLSAQERGALNAKKIHDWLATNPDIPMYKGKVNKTAICKQHEIPKSTLSTNTELQKLFASAGPIEELAFKQKQSNADVFKPADREEPPSLEYHESTSELLEKVNALEKDLNSIRLDLASEEFLLATGRYIPRLYNYSKGE